MKDQISDEVETLLINVAQILDVVKTEWAESWSPFDQEQRDHITKLLRQKRGCPHCGSKSHPIGCCAQDGHGG